MIKIQVLPLLLLLLAISSYAYAQPGCDSYKKFVHKKDFKLAIAEVEKQKPPAGSETIQSIFISQDLSILWVAEKNFEKSNQAAGEVIKLFDRLPAKMKTGLEPMAGRAEALLMHNFLSLQKKDEALEHFKKALKLLQPKLGADSPGVSVALASQSLWDLCDPSKPSIVLLKFPVSYIKKTTREPGAKKSSVQYGLRWKSLTMLGPLQEGSATAKAGEEVIGPKGD